MKIPNRCILCGKTTTVIIPKEKEDNYYKWSHGTLSIQRALPWLSPTEREVLISGICPECQKEIFE